MHALNTLEPTIQQLHNFDWSSGHAKSQDCGLLISSMNMKYGGVGGKQLRDSELTDDCVGDESVEAFLYYVDSEDGPYWSREVPEAVEYDLRVTRYDCRVYAGDIQHFSFIEKEGSDPCPPFYDLTAPLVDEPILDKNGKPVMRKDGKPKVKEGYAGKAKGIAQVLWERGLWKEGMV